MAVAVVAIGCAKDEVFDTPQVSDYAVEFSVADKGGFDATTRAVKTAWAAGDQIAIFCRPTSSGDYVSDNAKIIYLKYDGSAWSASPVSVALVAEMESSGKFSAIHHRVGSDENITVGNSGTLETFNGGELLYYAGNYTKADGVISLGSITMSLFPNSDYAAGRLFQVSVPGLNAADGWTMTIANDNYTPSESNVTDINQLAHYATYNGRFRFAANDGTIGSWGGGYASYSKCLCVQNGDDISFVFERIDDLADVDANKRYHFYLTNGTAVYTYTIDRGAYDGAKYVKNLEVGHAYLLPAISKWTNHNAPANDEIWYTNGSTTEPTAPNDPAAFGDATIQSNTYDAEKECWIITFDKDVTEIEDYAFHGYQTDCNKLTSVTIPDSVTMIGEGAFAECVSLTSVTIGDSVTTIGDYAFSWCESLTSVTIPDSVTTIGVGVFQGCIGVKEFKGKYAADGGRCLVDGTKIVGFALGCGATTYAIPDGITVVGNSAFYMSSLTSVTIPDSVKEFEDFAFSSNENLVSINIPAGVTAIPPGAFEYCIAIEDITLPDSITSIGDYAFYGCESLESITIPNNVTTIGELVFEWCAGLTSVTIPAKVSSIGLRAFYNCANLDVVYCKPTVPPTGGKDMFTFYDYDTEEYKIVSKIYVPAGSVEAYKAKEYWSAYKDYIFAEGVESEPANDEIWYTATAKVEPYDKTVFGATYLSNVWDSTTGKGVISFDGNVTKIGDYAFAECVSLTSVTIPDSVTTIGENAFYDCESLTSVTIPDSVTTIGYCAFNDCGSLTSVTIGDSVKTIGDYAISWCPNLTSVTIPDSVTTIGVGAFEGCDNLKEFKGKFAADNGRCLIKDNTIIAYANASGTTYTIPDSVTTIGEEAFLYCSSLTSVTIPDSVKTIGNYAFADCEGLASVTIGNSVTTIGNYAFNYCTNLTNVNIPDSVTTIGNGAFGGCESLKEFKGKFAAADGRCLIMDNTLIAYAYASGTTYTIPDSVTTIGRSIFSHCYSLTSVTIPDSVTTIGNGAFYSCKSLKTVYCKPTTPPAGGNQMFYNNASDRKIYVPAGSVEAYKAKEYWSAYKDYIFAE